MTEVTETQLPGVGVRYDFTTVDGEQVGVVAHHSGRRDLLAYDRDDPDVGRTVLQLGTTDARTMSELLGGTHVSEVLGAVQQRIEGLALDWVEVPAGSAMVGRSIGEEALRTRTGAYVVAVIRDGATEPAPGPDFSFAPGDVVVATGTPPGLEQLRSVLRS